MAHFKGQNLRVFVNNKCIAVATSCQFHVALQLEDASTKDDTDGWQKQEVVGKSWDVSCDALYDPTADSDDNAVSPATLMAMAIASNGVVHLAWQDAKGDKNRTGGMKGFEGMAYLNDVSVTAPNKSNSTATFQFTGNGELKSIEEE